MKLYEATGKYKQIISREEALKEVQKCSDALSFADTPITRGMTGSEEFYILHGEAGSRASTNTNNIYTIILSELLGKKGYPRRSASIICANYTGRYYASSYGESYRILPNNGVAIGVCPEIDMFATPIKFAGKEMTIVELNDIIGDLLNFAGKKVTNTTTYDDLISNIAYSLELAKNSNPPYPHLDKFTGVTPKNSRVVIETVYKNAKFSLATPATSEIFNDGNPHELWIGGPCLAIREDVYYDFIEESLK